MRTIQGIVGESRATPANRDAVVQFWYTVYRHAKGNEDTLDSLVSEDLG
jgi:hypothetical protein